MEIVVGGAKQDKAPIGHVTTSPHCRKENTWMEHHHRVHLAVAVKATEDNSTDHVILWQSPKKRKK